MVIPKVSRTHTSPPLLSSLPPSLHHIRNRRDVVVGPGGAPPRYPRDDDARTPGSSSSPGKTWSSNLVEDRNDTSDALSLDVPRNYIEQFFLYTLLALFPRIIRPIRFFLRFFSIRFRPSTSGAHRNSDKVLPASFLASVTRFLSSDFNRLNDDRRRFSTSRCLLLLLEALRSFERLEKFLLRRFLDVVSTEILEADSCR